jgi:hypothetical protein
MKWLTEYPAAQATIVSIFESEKKVVCLPKKNTRQGSSVASIKIEASLAVDKNRFIAWRYDRGDNLSVRFHIQNSISLTIAMLPRII